MEAQSWLSTPYQHAQRLKGLAVDCAGLPLEVYSAVGLIPPTDVGLYSNQWHLHRSREMYLEWVDRFGSRIPVDQSGPGDFLVFRFGRTFSHGAIALDGSKVIHAYAPAGCVTVDDRDRNEQLKGAPVIAFTFWAPRHGS